MYNSKRFSKTNLGQYGFNHNFYSYVSELTGDYADTMAEITAADFFKTLAFSNTIALHSIFYITDKNGITQTFIVTVTSSTEIALSPYNGGLIEQVADVSSAEILLLRAAPKTLAFAPGADKFLQFVDASLVLDYGTTGYTESDDNLAVKYTDGSGVAVSDTIECTGFIDQVADTLTNALTVKDTIVAATGAVDQVLVLHNTGDGEFAAGDGTLQVTIHYRVLTTNLV